VRLTTGLLRRPIPRLCEEDAPIVPPPDTVFVEGDRPPVLYAPDGTPLVRVIGF
jgi:hypothetical protein